MADGGSKLKKSLNVVHSDEIWKDHINRELLAQKNWPQKWGFLSDIYRELETENKGETSLIEEKSKDKVQCKNKQGFPKTDSQMIGWKSTLAKPNPYGIPESHAKGKCDILRTFDWPQESQ